MANNKLGVAYNMQRKMPKMMSKGGITERQAATCPDCMAMGGKCMAHGGEVENEKLNPEHEESMPSGMREDLDAMDDMGDNESEEDKLNRGGMVMKGRMAMKPAGDIQSNKAKFADGGIVDEIMKDRKPKNEDYLEDPDVESDFEPRIDMEPVHTREDEMHDTESGSEDDESLVGQIMKERKMRRRG